MNGKKATINQEEAGGKLIAGRFGMLTFTPNQRGLIMHQLSQTVKSTFTSTTRWGVLGIITGILVLGFPLITGLSLAMLVGISMLFTGFAQAMFAFQSGSIRTAVMRLLFGGITLFAGAVIVVQPGMALAPLTLSLAIYFFAGGLTGMVTSTSVAGGLAKVGVIFDGGISLMLGVMIWRGWPVSDAWAIGILLGSRLIVAGVTMLALGSIRRAVMGESQSA